MLSNLVTLTFVVSSMLNVGLGLTLFDITQPLRSARLVIMALVANFVIVPIAAMVIVRFIPLEPDHEIGLILLSVAAGAPFLPKLAQVAKADLPFAVALMALLIVTTVIYLPIALPLFSPGIQVDGASIALSLLVTILFPLGLGLFVRWQFAKDAHKVVPALTVISNISLALLVVLLIGLNVGKVLAMVGNGSILAIVILTVVATATGFVCGAPRRESRRVLALGTSQRNMAACFIIANSSFGDRPEVLVLLAAASVISMVLVMPVAVAFGKRAVAAAPAAGDPPESSPSAAAD
jgi:bile acid:Na+ symporter, BASS family